MKILVNRKIKLFFSLSVLSVMIFSLLSVLLICLNVKHAAIYVLALSLCMFSLYWQLAIGISMTKIRSWNMRSHR